MIMKTSFKTAAGAALLVIATGLGAAACTHGPSAQQQEQNAQSADTASLEQSQPLPHYNYSQIRQTLIDAQDIEANGTQTTSFFFQQGMPDPIFSCPSLGEPVANTDQLSNPQQLVPVTGNWGGGHDVLSQMDPNGIYTGSSSQGTYVICVNGRGQPYLQYWEGNVMTVTAGAVWDHATHQVTVTGAPTATVHTGKGK
jgi:hypothetical protein